MAHGALSSGTCGDLLPAEPYNLLCVVLTLLLLGVVGRSLVRLYATYRLTQVLASSRWQWQWLEYDASGNYVCEDWIDGGGMAQAGAVEKESRRVNF